jgi:membrane protease YdiL (CAAX protease family)
MPLSQARGSRRKSSALRTVVYFILIAACAFGGAFTASLLTPRGMAAAYAWLIKATAVMLLVLALTHAFLRRDLLAWSDFGMTARGLPAAIAWGVAWGALLAGAWLAAVWFLTPFEVDVNAHVLLLHFVATCGATVAMGIAEEVGYRTYGLRALRERGGYWTAALVPTAIFIAAHVSGGVPWLAGVLVVGSASVLFAVVMLETNKLPLVVALHATTNFIQDNLLRTSPDSSLFNATFAGTIADTDRIYAWIALALINALATIAVIGWSRRSARTAKTPWH